MSATKKTLVILLALVLTAAVAFAAPTYNTREVSRATFSVSKVFNGSVVYQQTQWINNRVGGAYLSEVLVEEEQTISAGDTLITYTAPVSSVEITRRETELSQAIDDYEYELGRRELLISEYRDASLAASDPDDARRYELLAQREEIELERYRIGAEAEIASLTAARDAAVASTDPKPVTSAIDGTIYYITALDPGQAIDNGRDIAGIFTPESMIISVSNTDGLLKYGMRVSMRLDKDGMVSGTVVSCDNVLPGALQSGMAYILPDTFLGPEGYQKATITAEILNISNVVMVSSNTLQYQNGRCYARVVDEEGAVHTRYVNVAMSNDTAAWIYDGVEPGEKLIAK